MKITLRFERDTGPNPSIIDNIKANLIKLWDNADYFHIEIGINNQWIAAHTTKGVQIDPFEEHRDETFDYFELEVPDLTEQQQKVFDDFLNSQLGSGYDWVGIYLSQLLYLNWEHPTKWFCSEIVAKILQLYYVDEFIDCTPNKLSPQDVFKLIEHKLVKA